MATKLNWVYQDRAKYSEYRAEYKGLVLRAVHDDSPSNPFTDGDCNWPIVVRSPDAFHDHISYVFGEEHSSAGGHKLDCSMLTDAALVHNQHHIAKLLGSTVRDLMECYLTDDPVKHCWEAELLRDAFDQAINDRSMSELLRMQEELCGIAGVPAYRTTVTGYCQGDWAEVLVIATPEAVERFGCTDVTSEDLRSTAKLYGSWAFGDVYGYIVERPAAPVFICSHCHHEHAEEVDDCEKCGQMTYEEEPEEGEELDSCWGFYGADFDESGLEDAAMSAADYHAKELCDA